MTYISFAFQIAISYIYFVSIGTSHSYPKFFDYRYYSLLDRRDEALRPESILHPFLSIGFGLEPPMESTIDISGSKS